MKIALSFSLLLLAALVSAGQNLPKTIYISPSRGIHLRSPEKIRYVDLSSKAIKGSLVLDNLLKISLNDSCATEKDLGVISIAAERFFVQYHLVASPQATLSELEISAEDMLPLLPSKSEFSISQISEVCRQIRAKMTKRPLLRVKNYGLQAELYAVYALGDLLFVDLGIKNPTNMPFEIDSIGYSLQDKKALKATNSQSTNLKIVYSLDQRGSFLHSYRNIYVIKRISFPPSRVLEISVQEKQPSSRMLILKVDYAKLLSADTP